MTSAASVAVLIYGKVLKIMFLRNVTEIQCFLKCICKTDLIISLLLLKVQDIIEDQN